MKRYSLEDVKIAKEKFGDNDRVFKFYLSLNQRTLNCFVSGNIDVCLTSFLAEIDSAALLMFNHQQIYLLGQIQTSQTGGQLCLLHIKEKLKQ